MRKILFIVFVSVLGLSGLFFSLWVQQAFCAQNVEIFVGGKKYNSLEEYRINGRMVVDRSQDNDTNFVKKQDFDDMFEQAVRRVSCPLDLKFPFREINHGYLKNALYAQPSQVEQGSSTADPFSYSYVMLNQIGVNTGIHNVVENFVASKDMPDDFAQVNHQDVKQVSQKTVETYDGPMLLMSDHERVRVMGLESLDGKATSATKMKIQ